MRDIGHFIGGKVVKGKSGRTSDVFDPNTCLLYTSDAADE